MSRVRSGQKFVNVATCSGGVTGPSKVVRMHSLYEDYHRAPTLSAWLFMKYDMKYSTFRGKSQARKEALRTEYQQDTCTGKLKQW